MSTEPAGIVENPLRGSSKLIPGFDWITCRLINPGLILRNGSGAAFVMKQQPTDGLRAWILFGRRFNKLRIHGLHKKLNGYVTSVSAFVLIRYFLIP